MKNIFLVLSFLLTVATSCVVGQNPNVKTIPTPTTRLAVWEDNKWKYVTEAQLDSIIQISAAKRYMKYATTSTVLPSTGNLRYSKTLVRNTLTNIFTVVDSLGNAFALTATGSDVDLSPYAKITYADSLSTQAAGGNLTGHYPNPTIKAGAIKDTMIANGAVGTNQLANLSVTTSKLADNAVTGTKIASHTITGINIAFLTIEGTNIALNTIEGANIASNTISEDKLTFTSLPPNGSAGGDLSGSYPDPTIAYNAVTTTKIADLAVTRTKIANSAIDDSKLDDGAVSRPKLSNMGATNGQVLQYNSGIGLWTPTTIATGGISSADTVTRYVVMTRKAVDSLIALTATGAAGGSLQGYYPNPTIAPGAVNSLELQTNSVTNSKLTTNSVSTNKLQDSIVTSAKLTTGSVTNSKIADDAVTSSKMATGTVTHRELGSNAVEVSNIADGNVTAVKLNHMGASNGQALVYNSSTSLWTPTTIATGGISSADTVTRYVVMTRKAVDSLIAIGAASVTASSGLTLASGDIKLGGTLTQSATIGTSASFQFRVTGLQSANLTDSIVMVDALTGALRRRSVSSLGIGGGGATANVGDSTNITLIRTGQDSLKAIIKNGTLDSTKIKDKSIAPSDLNQRVIDTITTLIAADSTYYANINSIKVPKLKLLAGGVDTMQVRIAFNGDSNFGDAFIRMSPFKDILQQQGYKVGLGYIPFTGGSLGALSSTGTWARRYIYDSPASVGLNGTQLESTGSGTNTVVITASDKKIATFTKFKIFYLKQSGGGSFSVSVDGGSATTFNTANATTTLGVDSIVGLTDTLHTVTVTTTNTSPVTLFGINVYNATNQIVLDNYAIGGTTTGSWLNSMLSPIFRQQLDSVKVDLIDIELGTNDLTQHSTATVFRDRYVQYLDSMKNHVGGIILGAPSDHSYSGTASSIPQYDSVIYTICKQNGYGYFSLNKLYKGMLAPEQLAKGFKTDLLHYSYYAGRINANALINALNIPFSKSFNGWATTGNEGTSPTTNFIGTIDAQAFVFKTTNVERMRIKAAGGIDITNDINVNGLNIGRGTRNIQTNVAIGGLTDNLQSGAFNVAVGVEALKFNTTGATNTSVGYQSTSTNTTGGSNTSFGYQSLRGNSTGSYNFSFGRGALLTNTIGEYNGAFGGSALGLNTTGSYNSGLGAFSLFDLTTGSYNVAVGHNTGRGITTGQYNTIIGAQVSGLSSSLSNNIIIADGQGNRRINVDNTGKVGINTTTPSYRLDLNASSEGNPLRLQGLQAGTTLDSLLSSSSAAPGVAKRLDIKTVVQSAFTFGSASYDNVILAGTRDSVTITVAGLTTSTGAADVCFAGNTLERGITISPAKIETGQIKIYIDNNAALSASLSGILKVTVFRL